MAPSKSVKRKSVSLLVLGDIHFGKLADSPDFVSENAKARHHLNLAVSMKDDLITKLQNEKLDGILVAGDLTSIGSPAEFAGCMDVVKKITKALHVPAGDVFTCFGNHDVDWRISKLSDIEEKDEGYHHAAACVGELFLPKNPPTVSGPLPGAGYFERATYCITVLNSGYFSSHDQKYRHGKLGSGQLQWFKELSKRINQSAKWQILMVHHHPYNYAYPTPVEDISCIEEGAELVDLLGSSRVNIVCHGHRHHPKIHTEFRSGWLAPVTFFCSGSVAVEPNHRNKGEIPNCFHVLKLHELLPDGSSVGSVRTFQYTSPSGWIDAAYSRSLPMDAVQWFGAVNTASERHQIMKEMLEANLKNVQNQVALLPSIEKLPFQLRCLPHHQLNELVETVANELGRKTLGKYPKDIGVY